MTARFIGARGWVVVALTVATAACSTVPTAAGTSSANVSGRWHYVATSTSSPSIDGTMTLTAGSGATFSGTLDASETNAAGQRTPLIGLISGRAADATSIEFDIVIGSSRSRHHVATLHADSIGGSWIESGQSGTGTTGSFHANRSAP